MAATAFDAASALRFAGTSKLCNASGYCNEDMRLFLYEYNKQTVDWLCSTSCNRGRPGIRTRTPPKRHTRPFSNEGWKSLPLSWGGHSPGLSSGRMLQLYPALLLQDPSMQKKRGAQ